MNDKPASNPQRLDQIETQWSLLRLAHEPVSVGNVAARQRVLLKYNKAIRSYVGALMQDDNSADEVSQDILVRLLQGNFAGADPARGRFRDFLKVAVRNIVRTFWSQKQRRGMQSLDELQISDREDDIQAAEPDAAWRATILDLAMRRLEQFERSHSGCHYHTILRMRTDYPDVSSAELADLLSRRQGKPVTAEVARQQLRRGRLRFAQILIEEIAASLNSPNPDTVEQELIDLGLMEIVRPFLPDNWRASGELCEPADE